MLLLAGFIPIAIVAGPAFAQGDSTLKQSSPADSTQSNGDEAVDAKSREERLFAAARGGDVQQVKTLLSEGVDVNAETNYGATALSFACDRGHAEVARLLLAAGAKLNVRDTFYRATPLDWAASGGHAQIVAMLLEQGAEGARGALHAAARGGDRDVVDAVLQNARLDLDDIRYAQSLASTFGHPEVAQRLDAANVGGPPAPDVVPPETLSAYLGTYRSEDGDVYEVEHHYGRLVLRPPVYAPLFYRPRDARTFASGDNTVRFERDGDAVTGFVRTNDDQESRFARITAAEALELRAAAPAAERAVTTQDDAFTTGNWPTFRGPGARGIAEAQSPPVKWDVPSGANVRWKTPIPGLANSSPIVWEDKVFVTTAISSAGDDDVRPGIYGDVASVEDDSVHMWKLYCLDKETGEIAWERTAHEGVPDVKRHPKSTQANCTPVTDGQHVVALFNFGGLLCYDTDGRLLWKRMLGRLDSGWFYDPDYQWGFASSPILFRDTVIVQCDIQENSFIAAFDVRTGEPVWRTERDEIPSWGTPTVYENDEHAVLITNATRFARGYNPYTGEELWRISGNSEITVPTPFVAHDLIYVASGYRPVQPIWAIRPGSRGDLSLPDGETSSDAVAWSNAKAGPYMPTPIVYGDYLYTCDNGGVLCCYEAATGKRIYRQRFARGGGASFVAAPVAADGRLYLTGEEGTVYVVQTGPEYALLSANPVGENCLTTPAISAGMLLLRTQRHVIALMDAPPPVPQATP